MTKSLASIIRKVVRLTTMKIQVSAITDNQKSSYPKLECQNRFLTTIRILNKINRTIRQTVRKRISIINKIE